MNRLLVACLCENSGENSRAENELLKLETDFLWNSLRPWQLILWILVELSLDTLQKRERERAVPCCQLNSVAKHSKNVN